MVISLVPIVSRTVEELQFAATRVDEWLEEFTRIEWREL